MLPPLLAAPGVVVGWLLAGPTAAAVSALNDGTLFGRGHWHRVIPGNFRRPFPAAAGRAHHAGAGAVSVNLDLHLPPPLCRTPLPLLLIMADTYLTRLPRSVAEVLGTGLIPAELAAILAEHPWTVRKDDSACTPEERTGQVLPAFLSHLALGEVPVPDLEKVTVVGVDEDGRVHLMHSLFSVRVNVYSIECCLFACIGGLPAEGLPQVTELLPDFFAARHAVRTML